MQHVITPAVILQRTNYGEADRILTVLTPQKGKLSLIAKGVRREKSKLAGGVELFSVSELSYLPGRGEVSTLTSSRLQTHFTYLANDLDRTMRGYEILKIIHKATESQTDEAYFQLLAESLEGLNTAHLSIDMVYLWFNFRLLQVSGHAPNVTTDSQNHQLKPDALYGFDYQDMMFEEQPDGPYTPNHIKLVRLALTQPMDKMSRINVDETVLNAIVRLSVDTCDYHLRVR